ncbi:MAG TPA: DUF5681 domain-containing protein [Reyranella sp.]|jgi:hypothetical protein|nr:DUF5681 domain-containing protein [Reyranella sp.]
MSRKAPRKPANSGRQQDGTFAPGQSGNPAGRPQGSRNRASVVLDALAAGEATEIVQKVLEAAKGGDMRAAELVLSRLWPLRKGRPVSLPLPAIKTSADTVAALGAITDAVAAGDLTPDEGAAVAGVIEIKRKAIETVELEARISALEKKERSK